MNSQVQLKILNFRNTKETTISKIIHLLQLNPKEKAMIHNFWTSML